MRGRQRVISGDRRRVLELSDVEKHIKKETTEERRRALSREASVSRIQEHDTVLPCLLSPGCGAIWKKAAVPRSTEGV